jgi:hypothetical protein
MEVGLNRLRHLALCRKQHRHQVKLVQLQLYPRLALPSSSRPSVINRLPTERAGKETTLVRN